MNLSVKTCFATFAVLLPQLALGQAPEASAMVLAQTDDRCMTTYAVRTTRTETPDDEIFATAVEGCKALRTEFFAAIDREYSADDASKLKTMLNNDAKSDFMNLLQQIRSDRLQRQSTSQGSHAPNP